MNHQYVAISFLIGFFSLSQEIIWVRIISFLGNSVPSAFSYVLFCYIIGIALGSLAGSRISNTKLTNSAILAALMVTSSLCSLVSPEIIKLAYANPIMPLVSTCVIFFSAAANGAIFPLVHHWYTKPGLRMGQSLSTIYFANVMGSAVGPVTTGFMLLDFIPMFLLLQIIAMMELCIASILLLANKQWKLTFIPGLIALFALPWLDTHQGVIRSIIKESSVNDHNEIGQIIENRHGIIHTLIDKNTQYETVFGGNVYDGGFSVNLEQNRNGIDRAFLLPALRGRPEKVLFIGLSSGSWLRVVSSVPTVRTITVAEINPGYKKLIDSHRQSESLLTDSRITIHYKDGRQLVEGLSSTNETFDLIVMNNTWHWRAYSTNLMSIEFMNRLKTIMHSDSLLAFNSTYSPDAVYTAGQTFSYVSVFKNFVYASQSPLVIRYEDACNLNPVYIDGQSCANENHLAAIKNLEHISFSHWNEAITQWNKGRKPEVITDSNMITEFKYGRKFSLSPL